MMIHCPSTLLTRGEYPTPYPQEKIPTAKSYSPFTAALNNISIEISIIFKNNARKEKSP